MEHDASQLPLNLEPMERDSDVLRRIVHLVQERLPRGWRCEIAALDVKVGLGRRADALIEIRSPTAERATLIAEIRRVLVTKDLRNIIEQLLSLDTDTLDGREFTPIVLSRYLSKSARNWLTAHEISYADATGNLQVSLDRPGLYIRDFGADRDPWRSPGRPRGSLHGQPAACVVRALADYRSPIPISRLLEISGVSTGAVYRVVDFLEEEALIERGERGIISHVSWRRMIERWSRDYSFLGTNSVGRFLQPRGISRLLDDLQDFTEVRHAVTGSLAAHEWAPYASARSAMIYVDNIPSFATALDLRLVDSGANVLLANAKYDVVFERTSRPNGVVLVSPSQAAVDLLTGPGRNPSEAEMLMDWMERHEYEWRRPAP